MDEVAQLILVEPRSLLPQHRHLLETDFEKLGSGDTLERQYWLANMTSAIQAANSLSNTINSVHRPVLEDMFGT
jgi:hypothetical protein